MFYDKLFAAKSKRKDWDFYQGHNVDCDNNANDNDAHIFHLLLALKSLPGTFDTSYEAKHSIAECKQPILVKKLKLVELGLVVRLNLVDIA